MLKLEKALDARMEAIRKVVYATIILLFASQVVVVFSQVVWRFAFNNPFSWSEELARYMQVWLILLTSSVCIRKSRHLAVDYLSHHLSFKVQKILKLVSLLGIMAYVIVMVVFGIQMITVTASQTTPAMQIPIGLVYLAFPIAGILMFLETFIVLAKVVIARTPDELYARRSQIENY